MKHALLSPLAALLVYCGGESQVLEPPPSGEAGEGGAATAGTGGTVGGSTGQGGAVGGASPTGVGGTGTGGEPPGGGLGGAGGNDSGGEGGVPSEALSCEQAALDGTHVGCEFFPTVTPNHWLYETTTPTAVFDFAVVALNDTDTPASVSVERDGTVLVRVTVEPRGRETIELPWVEELQWSFAPRDNSGHGPVYSGIARGGAFRVKSSVPITLYQFNPHDVLDQTEGDQSSSIDGSLLLPRHALGTDHYVLSWPAFARYMADSTAVGGYGAYWFGGAAFLTVTAVDDETTVTVTASGAIRGGTDIPAFAPGEMQTFALDAGDVLLLHSELPPDPYTPTDGETCTSGSCLVGVDLDLTGTRVTADRPLLVIAGQDFSHMEDVIPPVGALGTEVVVPAPALQAGDEGPYYLRVVSTADANAVTLTGDNASDSLTLNAGEWREVGPVEGDRVIQASAPVAAMKVLAFSDGYPGGAMVVPTPVAAFLTHYAFYAATTFETHFVDVVMDGEGELTLDGEPLDGDFLDPIAGSRFRTTRIAVAPGHHTIDSTRPVGLTVYGFSLGGIDYMVPGGLGRAAGASN